MLTGRSRSLLHFIETPIAVADGEARLVYANPAFESRLGLGPGASAGVALAQLFEAGGREALLRACVDVCEGRRAQRFPVRFGGAGHQALVSPVLSDGARVGAILLLVEDVGTPERLLAFHRAIQEPVDELARALDELIEHTGGRREERVRTVVEDGLRALGRLRKWTEELQDLALGAGGGSAAAAGDTAARFDAVALVRGAAASVARDARAVGVALDVLTPARLPLCVGDGGRLEAALVHWLRSRLAEAPPPRSLTLAAKRLGGEAPALLVSVQEEARLGASETGAGEHEPELGLVFEAVAALRGDVRSARHGATGRSVSIRLDAATS